MLSVGLTGGIGSGKSTVARIFGLLGIPVFDADTASKRLMNEDKVLKDQLINAFGEKVYINGQLDRQYLSGIVFSNPEKLTLLNSIVHPATIQQAKEWISKQKGPYIIKEAALIFESGSQKDLDYVIGVYAPVDLRIQRTMARDNISFEKVQARMNAQMDEKKKMALCDFIIKNDEIQLILPQILSLHDTLTNLAIK